jgi:predicted aspartyl protease
MSVTLALCLRLALLAAAGTVPAQSLPPATAPQPASAAPLTEQPLVAEPLVPEQGAVEPEALFASATRVDRIGRVMAPVMINGQGPYRLVVDTGASHSTFSPRLVAQLGLSPSLEARIVQNGVTGAAEVPTVAIEKIQAGDLLIRNVQVPVVWSSIMANADGILGVAGLRSERILIDFRRDRIVISRSPNIIDPGRFLRIPARKVEGGLLMVDVRIGGVSARAIIDTGAERTLGNAALRDALRARKRGKEARWANTEVYGATTQVANGESSVAPAIKLGPALINGTEVVYGDFHIFKLWNLESRPAALIGMDVLGTVGALVVDYSRHELLLDVGGGTSRATNIVRDARGSRL